MNDQWQSKEAGRSTNVGSHSGPTPSLIRPSLQDAIRPGTVASRIQSIQKLASPSPPRSHPPPISITRGEDSRTGFGRRVCNRFGKPALVNTNPDEEPHMETAWHCYLGLNTPRVAHQQRHAIFSHRTKYARSPGINGQMIPDGMKERMQHDAAVPWEVLSRSNRTRSMGRHVTDLETDVQTESYFPRTEALYLPESSEFRSDDEETTYLNLYRWNIESRPGDTINSQASNATTSTIRRQSVRDLFKDFGIERPAGLVSGGQSYETEETPKQAREKRLCHTCLRINTRFSITCSRCSHKLCYQCDKLSPLPGSREKKASGNKKHEHRGENQASKENWTRYRGLLKESNSQPTETQKRSSQETLRPQTKVPDEQPVNLFASQKNSSRIPKEEKSLPDEASAWHFRIGSQVPSHVKDSPFLIADQLAASWSLAPYAAGFSAKNDLDNQTAGTHRIKDFERQQSVFSFSDGKKCSSSNCQGTHPGRQPYKHAISCEKRRRHVHKYSDEVYSADTSRVEDANHVHSKILSHTTEHRGRYSHKAKANPGLAHISGPFGLDSQSSREQEVSEFVECHGYPRTGHSHLGSPVSSGIIGECQHCLHDCHCDSCKSTFHSVRCCVHGDHQAKVHHHLTPKNGGSMKSEISSTAVKPKTSSKSALHKSMAIVSPTPEHKVCTEQKVATVASQATKCSAHQKQRSEEPQPIKRPSLQKTKHSSPMLNNVTKRPTPPPWVASSRKHSISGIAKIDRWQETKRVDSKNVSNVKPLGDLVPSNERPASPPPSTDEKVAEDTRSNFYDQVTTSRYDEEHQHFNEHCQNYRRPSKSSIVEKSSRPANTRPPSRMKVSSPGSRRASRRLSALFQMQEKTSVPLLNQKLLEHQEQLRRNITRKECEDKLEGVVKKVERSHLGDEHGESDCNLRPEEKEAVRAGCNEGAGQKEAAKKTSNWRLDEKNKAKLFTDARPEEKPQASTAQRSQKESDLKNIAKESLEPFVWDKTREKLTSKLKLHEKERVEKTRNVARDEQGRAKKARNDKLAGEETSGTTRNKKLDERARTETVVNKRPELNDRVESVESGDMGTVRKKAWKIRLVDRQPSPVCVNDGPVEQHPQADCEVTSRGTSFLASLLGNDRELSPTETEEHNCVWKTRLLEFEQIEGLGIRGVTVLLHLDRREDVIFKATDWKGGELRREN